MRLLFTLAALALPAVAQTATTTTLTITSGGGAVTTVPGRTVVTLTATVQAGAVKVSPGLVTFCDATAKYCEDIHIAGTAQLTATGTATVKFRPSVGNHSYKAVFSGTNTYAASASAASSLTVESSRHTVTNLFVSLGDRSYRLSATVGGTGTTTGPGPTGQVSFVDTTNSNAVLGDATLGSALFGISMSKLASPETGSYPNGIATADFNGDGIPDIAIPNLESNSVTVLLGNGDGTFTAAASLATDSAPIAIVTGDFNGDGIPDLAVPCRIANNADGVVDIFLGKGDGTFAAVSSPSTTGIGSLGIAVADFNGDGIPDLAVSNYSSNTISVLLGDGDGTFTAAPSPISTGSTTEPAGIVAADFNGDGIQDLAVVGQSDTVLVLRGHGDGTFTAFGSAIPADALLPSKVVSADFNGDGIPDLAIFGYSIEILLGNGDGSFTFAEEVAFNEDQTLAVGDFNGDGIADLVVVTATDTLATIVVGRGDGTFYWSTFSDYLDPSNSERVLVAAAIDLDGDGFPDVIGTGPNKTDNSGDLPSHALAALTQPGYFATAYTEVNNTAGTHVIEASYPGDGNYTSSISNSVTVVIPLGPSAESVTPSSGFGTTQQFSFVASSPNGAANLAVVRMLLNTSLSAVSGCYLRYSAADNQLRLLSDDGTAWGTPSHPGTTGTLSNSQCSVDLLTATVVANGNVLTVSPTITFKSGFQAGLQTYMGVVDVRGVDTGWQRMGWWMVGNMAEAPPSAVSVTPSSGFGITQQFSFLASSPNGAANLAVVRMLFSTSMSAANGCYLRYSTADNQLTLVSDDGTAWGTPGHPGATGTLSNSQCSVNLLTTTVVANGDTLTVSPTVTFESGFQAGVQIYMGVVDVPGLDTGWKRMGWWMVGSTAEAAPSAVSVTPSSGFGTTQQFSFVASSPNGAANLSVVRMLFNTSLSAVNGCFLRYSAADNQLKLVLDNGTEWGIPDHPGTTGTLSNSQCSVDLSTTTVVANGDTLTVSPTVTFKSGFPAGVQTYMSVLDIPGFDTGWKRMGWWMVGSTAEAPPSAVSVTPSSGFGTTQQFSFVASSPNGAANLSVVRMLFNTTLSAVNGCYLRYSAVDNELNLLSDNGTVWGTPGHPGATGTLSNSHCSLDLSTTTVVANGNTLPVSPTITFKSGFEAGVQIYMGVVDVSGFDTGWKKMSP